MSKQDFINAQTHVLSVNFRCKCDGCKRRIKKRLDKIDGVYATAIDAEQGKVSVTGSVEPDVLVKKLGKSGKHAEILSSEKGLSVFKAKNADQFDVVNTQLKNLQVSKKPEEKAGKDQQKDEGGGGKHNKQVAVQQVLQEMKASAGSKPPPVKVKDDDDDGDEDDAFGDADEDDYLEKVVHVAGKGGVKAAGEHKKGGGGVMSKTKMIGKAIGGKIGGKIGNKGVSEGKIGNKGGGGGFPDFEVTTRHSGGDKGKIGNKGGGEGFPDFEVTTRHSGGDKGKIGNKGGGEKLAPVEGMVATPMVSGNGGGVGPMPGNGSYQQQPYMGMVNGAEMDRAGVYGRMPPGGGYGYSYAPPMPPPAYQDPFTSVFSDENPEGCSIM